ncbi:thioredoxin domain-containing protein [Pedococcus sp. KACC 23699]|uniref:Thioredoxin domain-containing protein n=1 Tax=Pedococcus sp. KACC 23699 TaxID=3149228 RepID=A0AAU7JT79_9MICO
MTSSSASRKAKIQAATPKSQQRKGANPLVVATVVVVIVLAAVVGAVILGSQDKKAATTAGGSALPKGASAMGAGILVNPSAPANVPTLDLYEDFQCPICAEFEHRFGADITALADKGQVKLVYHTLSFLDDNLHNDSSNRAANAAACAADQDKFIPYHAANFGGQPLKEGAGYTDAALRSFAQKAGITGAGLTTWDTCYSSRAHNQYVVSVQTQSEKDGVNGTPTLKLNGKTLDLAGFTSESLAAAVKAATK